MLDESNIGMCKKCRARVPAEYFTREGQTWIRKTCPDCGVTESVVSHDAEAWQRKRDLWDYVPRRKPCKINCEVCDFDHEPNVVFVDVTNRCNMNCPICIANVKGMGFDFNPPHAYFEKIFSALGAMDPVPVLLLFGGEPTVRDDIFEIVTLARKHGLRPHIVTNGVRLADEQFTKKLCDARVGLRFAFDGHDPQIYEMLRHNRPAYDKKVKALEHVAKYSRRRHTMMATVGRGYNDHLMGKMLQFCHDNRELFSDIGAIPLTENWEEGKFEAVTHTTMEDVEQIFGEAVPGGKVEFIPLGLNYVMRKPRSFFRENSRSEVLLLSGVHPNCESMTWLISNGKQFRSISHYLRKGFGRAAADLAAVSRKIEPTLDKLDRKKFFQRLRGQMLIGRTFGWWAMRNLRFGRLTGLALLRLWRSLTHRPSMKLPSDQKRSARGLFQITVLPFEVYHSVDAQRLQNCKGAFACEDTVTGKVKFTPACVWPPVRNVMLKSISEKYGVVSGREKGDQAEPGEKPEQADKAEAAAPAAK